MPLLDHPAVLASMAYVDLNPIRAAIADRPETSNYTSVQDRIPARQAQCRAAALLAQSDAADLTVDSGTVTAISASGRPATGNTWAEHGK